MTDQDYTICERDTFILPPVFKCHDSGGLLGPHVDINDIGKRMRCFVQLQVEREIFQSPFDESLTQYLPIISVSVYSCELRDDKNTSTFSMFCLKKATEGTTFYSAAKKFEPFKNVNGFRFKSTFFATRKQSMSFRTKMSNSTATLSRLLCDKTEPVLGSFLCQLLVRRL